MTGIKRKSLHLLSSTLPFSLARKGEGTIALQPKSTAITKDLEGKWEGALDTGGKTLRLVVELSSQADGLGTGTLVSLDQEGTRIPIAAVVQAGARVTVAIPRGGGNAKPRSCFLVPSTNCESVS